MYESVQQNNNPFAKNIAHVKDFFRNPLVLILAIFNLITFVFTLIIAFSSISTATALATTLSNLDIISNSDARELSNNVGVNLLFSLPTIVTGILFISINLSILSLLNISMTLKLIGKRIPFISSNILFFISPILSCIKNRYTFKTQIYCALNAYLFLDFYILYIAYLQKS